MEQLAPGSALLLKTETRVRRLEAQLYGGEQLDMDDPRLCAAAAEWAGFEIYSLQATLMRSAQQVGTAVDLWSGGLRGCSEVMRCPD